MGILRGAMKSGLALKAARVAQRELSKPENQRKIKELLGKARGRGTGTGTKR